MGFLFSTLQLLAALTILVFIHELGHFLAAKAFNMRVDKFYIFFDAWGKKLFSKTKGETEYGIGWLPLGGYVKIHGMIDESMDKDSIGKEPADNEFRSKPAWQRLVVMLGGIVFNIILGLIIFTMIYKVYEKSYLPNEALTNGIYAHELAREQGLQTGDKIISVNGKKIERFKDAMGITARIGSIMEVERNGKDVIVEIKDIPFDRMGEPFIEPRNQDVNVAAVLPGMNAEKAGMQAGDQIVSVDGQKISTFGQFQTLLTKKGNSNINVGVMRDEQLVNLSADVTEDGKLGFQASSDYSNYYEFKPYTIGKAMKYSLADGWETVYTNWKGFGRIAQGKESLRKNIKSPLGMIELFPSTWNGYAFWKLTGVISFILAFMNLLPIPALDGGHATFLIWEMVTRRKPSDNFLMKAQVAGMIFLLAFMVFAFGNDIVNLVSKYFGG